ncbi:MAG: DUF3368 domain-containing protein [Bacteroidales bacterium]|nr:DUF3368 domain-containing protein [Bacteroidales bacterium]MBS3776559.1 DUF3368 domain-containing protein [Bacteroidales bacterium]
MHRVVIPDTSSLILFHKIGEVELLEKVYKNLTTTKEIAEEFNADLPDWIKIVEVGDKKYQEALQTQIDTGEASAIALAKENENPLLILDDRKARKVANKLNLRITGVLGIIHKAKQVGVITKVKPLIDELLSTDFRISEKLINELLRINNED